MFKDKKILVAGGVGLIGRQLVDLLLLEGAHVFVSDIKVPEAKFLKKISDFKKLDLTVYSNCVTACEGMDYVFNLLCIKGSPKAMKERPASHFVPMILFNTNLMEAAYKCKIKRYLYASSVAVYEPAPVMIEDNVWKTSPSPHDRFAGWAKRMGELQAEAYSIQYGWNDISIVRPANVYGPYDDFNITSSMVVPSLVKKILDEEDPLVIWGNGNNIRDFIHSKDVAKGMMLVMKKSPGPKYPINLGSGLKYSIKDLIRIIIDKSGKSPKIIWDTSKPTGDKIRVLKTDRAKKIGFIPEISLEDGIEDLIKWYIKFEK
jgi:GDP-L-fucose synthase